MELAQELAVNEPMFNIMLKQIIGMYINVIPDSILIAARLIYFYMLDEQYQEEKLFETMLAQTLNKIGISNHSLSTPEDEAPRL